MYFREVRESGGIQSESFFIFKVVNVKDKHSYTDAKGLRWVACSECERGGNGNPNMHKCSNGWKVKKFNGLGCFAGREISRDKLPDDYCLLLPDGSYNF